jgi:hypothetical protein
MAMAKGTRNYAWAFLVIIIFIIVFFHRLAFARKGELN